MHRFTPGSTRSSSAGLRLASPRRWSPSTALRRSIGEIVRPWEVGIIFDRHRALPDSSIDGFRAQGLNVGVNEPYSPADRVYYTLSRHAEARGLACAMIEIRNDLIRSDREQAVWAGTDRCAHLTRAWPIAGGKRATMG